MPVQVRHHGPGAVLDTPAHSSCWPTARIACSASASVLTPNVRSSNSHRILLFWLGSSMRSMRASMPSTSMRVCEYASTSMRTRASMRYYGFLSSICTHVSVRVSCLRLSLCLSLCLCIRLYVWLSSFVHVWIFTVFIVFMCIYECLSSVSSNFSSNLWLTESVVRVERVERGTRRQVCRIRSNPHDQFLESVHVTVCPAFSNYFCTYVKLAPMCASGCVSMWHSVNLWACVCMFFSVLLAAFMFCMPGFLA